MDRTRPADPSGDPQEQGPRPCQEVLFSPRAPGQPAHACWDLDVPDPTAWMRAVRLCIRCPFIDECRQERHNQYPQSNPRSVIWAAVAYSENGAVLDTAGLRRLAATHRGKKKPMPTGQTEAG